ncbi:MAG: hypothetical protein ACI849_001776 [Patiriisocius sp.]|jgi:hypothetical protein
MKKSSSKKNMEDPLRLLKTIQRVSVDDTLYEKVLQKTKAQQPVIQMSWLRIAAATLVCLLCSEGYMLVPGNNNENTDISELVTINNNTLYYE